MNSEKRESQARQLYATQRRVSLSSLLASNWTITRHTARQRATLRNSLELFGNCAPLVVRQVDTGLGDERQYYEVIDGNERLAYLVETYCEHDDFLVPVLDYGPIYDDEARALHLSLNVARGVVQCDRLADALEVASQSDTLDENQVLAILPLLDKTVGQAIEKFRRRARRNEKKENDEAKGWVNFRFRVDPQAAQVCDRALTVVEKTTDCKRPVAFERVCADFLAGPLGRGV